MKTILMKFSGPMQSWGTKSHFNNRDTDPYPSKSGVIGLISASLGYLRSDDRIIALNELGFGVRIDQVGILREDFHIGAIKGDYHISQLKKVARLKKPKEGIYLTRRQYLEDYIFVVGISHEDNEVMDNIYCALSNPYFQQYLGRRSCPLDYDFLLDISNEDLKHKLKTYTWQASDWYKNKSKVTKLEIYVDYHLRENDSEFERSDFVVSFSQESRLFSSRFESKILVDVPKTDDENYDHDIFGFLGD